MISLPLLTDSSFTMSMGMNTCRMLFFFIILCATLIRVCRSCDLIFALNTMNFFFFSSSNPHAFPTLCEPLPQPH